MGVREESVFAARTGPGTLSHYEGDKKDKGKKSVRREAAWTDPGFI